jgi:hypothetical protein
MTPKTEMVLARLRGVVEKGTGWEALCPSHDDHHPSLRIDEGEGGRVLLACRSHKCSAASIVAAIGLKLADLMPSNSNGHRPESATAMAPNRPPSKPSAVFETSEDAIKALEKTHGQRAAMWTYPDGQGEPCMVVARWNLSNGDKTFRPVSRNGQGWIIGAPKSSRPLYQLPKIIDADPSVTVFVTEGEKAADAAASLGLLVTTSSGGSQAAKFTDGSPLAGRSVVILPDHDEPGAKYAADVGAILRALNPPASVRIVTLPGLPNKGDVYDFIASGRAAGKTDPEIRQAIEQLAAKTTEPKKSLVSGPILTCMADVEPRDVQWLWKGRIPLGRLTLLVGVPGKGKSFVSMDLAARVSTGRNHADGRECPSGSVILISCEDDPADTIRKRLDAHGADVSRVHLLSGVRHVDADGEVCELMLTLADVDTLEAVLKTISDCVLIIVDPAGSYLGGKTDMHRDNEVRAVLAPVAKLAEKYGVAVLLIAHRRKMAGGSADETALGSRAFTGICRSVLHLMSDPQDKTRRFLLPGKCNLTAEGSGLAFRIVSDAEGRGVVAWEAGAVDMSADEGIEAEGGKGHNRESAQTDAEEWLRTFLADGMARLSSEIEVEAQKAGISKRTLWRAKTDCGIVARCSGFGGAWTWRLRNQAKNAEYAKSPNTQTLAHTGTTGHDRDISSKTQSMPSHAKSCQDCDIGDVGTLCEETQKTQSDDERPPLTDEAAESAMAVTEGGAEV